MATRALLLLCVLHVACAKVPLVDVEAAFALSDAAWFEEEETLFIFYRVEAEQGIAKESVIEVRYTTDDVEQPWTPIDAVVPVHTHLPVDCGRHTLCGSTSIHVGKVPRSVGVRLRYHRDSSMALDAPVRLNIIGTGPAYSNRSLIVYGVFDATNNRVQWRARHHFPTLRNEEVQALGLRRRFVISEQVHGVLDPAVLASLGGNPYAYGFANSCPGDFLPTTVAEPIETKARAVFNPTDFSLAVAPSPVICALATVEDGKGTYTTVAVARKNPEVRPAFPTLRSPVRENTPVRVLLAPCNRTISNPHINMQKQRLGIASNIDVCLDDWNSLGFADALAAYLRTRIDAVRPQGKDMVLVLALHHDDTTGSLAAVVEAALAEVLVPESSKSSPRASGAFVFDSYAHTIGSATVQRLVLWCPALVPDGEWESFPDTSQVSCPIEPDSPTLKLGPFRFSMLPILPSRARYLSFIDKYSEAQAGRMTSLSFRAPERTPLSDDVPVGPFGVATFFNDEVLTAAEADSFSFCAGDAGAPQPVVFRSAAIPDPLPLEYLPAVQQEQPQGTYELGLLWDFPFLMRLEYEIVLAGAATAFSATVPFGVGTSAESYYGTPLWQKGEFPLDTILLQCTRFCDHPTFDSAGVYNVGALFNETYLNNCYRPRFPTPADGGFPRDP